MLRLSLDAIHTIDTIARAGSFSAAAEVLHKVPSTISYTVAKLEEQMGITFFERNGPHVKLTALGQELLEEGRCLFSAAQDLESRLYKMAQGVEVELNITLDALFPLSALTDHIQQFMHSPQYTRLHFQQEVMTGTWEALMQQRADLIIAGGAGPAGGGYQTYPVGKVCFAFCVSPNHPLAAQTQPLSKYQLLEHTAIVIGDSARHLPLRTAGLYDGQKQITVSNLNDKMALQIAGLGHGFLPRVCIEQAIQQGLLIEMQVIEPKADETFYLAWRSGDHGQALTWWKNALSQQWLPEVIKPMR